MDRRLRVAVRQGELEVVRGLLEATCAGTSSPACVSASPPFRERQERKTGLAEPGQALR